MADHHEFGRAAEAVEGSSDRSFGLVFAGCLAILGAFNWWRDGRLWPVFFGLAAAFFFVALLRPGFLRPVNRVWTRLGFFLGAVVSPIVMAVLFFLVVTPMAYLLRLVGKDSLRLRAGPVAGSYWITREPPGPTGESMRDQF